MTWRKRTKKIFVSYSSYPPEFNEEFKRYIRKRDNFCCAVCHKRKKIDIHHIDYIKEHTTYLNCISLCRTCHFGIHRSGNLMRQEWKIRLGKIAKKREADAKTIR